MNHHRVPTWPRTVTRLPSRRDVLRGLAGAGPGLGIARLPDLVAAKKKHKRKKNEKQPKPNAFGCFNVGAACKTEEQCCSGICEGKKGKRQCRAHGTGTCDQQDPGICEAGSPLLAICNGGECLCFRTTGGSKYCADAGFVRTHNQCADCQKDADCLALGFPAGSACAPIGGDFACAETCGGGTACVIPCGAKPPPSDEQ
jgi:hypothetical protein